MDEGLKELFLRLPGLFGSVEQIRGAAELTGNPRALKAIGRLEEVHAILAERGLADYVTYDQMCIRDSLEVSDAGGFGRTA